MSRAALLAALALSAAGCIPEEGPLMKPGSDCLECHSGGEARRWTIAGTWRGQGFNVTIQDANGKTITLHTNQVGNFWSAEPMVFPLRSVSVDGAFMPSAAGPPGAEAYAQGSCNRCHDSHGVAGGDDD